MNSFHIPATFGDRPCDRMLVALLKAEFQLAEEKIRWMLFLVWRDYASARDDRRTVPASAAIRASSMPVAIIESYVGWSFGAGKFVESAIASGFFVLSERSRDEADLILLDFFPANRTASKDVSLAKLGGIGKAVASARRLAEAASRQQMDFFSRSAPELLSQFGRTEIKEAAIFVTQLCRIAQFPDPTTAEWKATLISQAIPLLQDYSEGEMHQAFKWVVANRGSQELPQRVDMLMARFGEFVTKGREAYGVR